MICPPCAAHDNNAATSIEARHAHPETPRSKTGAAHGSHGCELQAHRDGSGAQRPAAARRDRPRHFGAGGRSRLVPLFPALPRQQPPELVARASAVCSWFLCSRGCAVRRLRCVRPHFRHPRCSLLLAGRQRVCGGACAFPRRLILLWLAHVYRRCFPLGCLRSVRIRR